MSQVNKSDVESLAGKLQSFGKDLPDQEKQVLDWLVSRAQAMAEPGLTDDELSAASGGDGVTVAWSKSFNQIAD